MNWESGKIDFLQVKDVANLSSALQFKRTERGHSNRFTNYAFYSQRSCKLYLSEFIMSISLYSPQN